MIRMLNFDKELILGQQIIADESIRYIFKSAYFYSDRYFKIINERRVNYVWTCMRMRSLRFVYLIYCKI